MPTTGDRLPALPGTGADSAPASPAAPADAGPDTGWRSAWVAALDALELDVAATEALLDEEHRYADTPPADPWQAPQDLGALPLDLRPRADEILTRQLRAAHEIARRLTSNRQQTAVTARIETGEAVKRPLYLDCAM